MSEKNLEEEVPTNAMGASSSTTGPIVTYDPLMNMRKYLKDKVKAIWRRNYLPTKHK